MTDTQEEAARAHDLAALEYRGPSAVTNFDISRYIKHPSPIQIHQPQLFSQPLRILQPKQPPPPSIKVPKLEPLPTKKLSSIITKEFNVPVVDPEPISDLETYSGLSELVGDLSWNMCFNDYSSIALDRAPNLFDFFGGNGFMDVGCLDAMRTLPLLLLLLTNVVTAVWRRTALLLMPIKQIGILPLTSLQSESVLEDLYLLLL